MRAYIRPVVDSTAAAAAHASAATEEDAAKKAGYQKCAAMYEARRAHAAKVLGPAWVNPAPSTALTEIGG